MIIDQLYPGYFITVPDTASTSQIMAFAKNFVLWAESKHAAEELNRQMRPSKTLRLFQRDDNSWQVDFNDYHAIGLTPSLALLHLSHLLADLEKEDEN